MIIPIPIFIRQESREEIELRGCMQAHESMIKRKKLLLKDYKEFIKQFSGDPMRNPFDSALNQIFPDRKVTDLNLLELMQIGFTSDYIVRADFKECREIIK